MVMVISMLSLTATRLSHMDEEHVAVGLHSFVGLRVMVEQKLISFPVCFNSGWYEKRDGISHV